jgi:hypothetical protein
VRCICLVVIVPADKGGRTAQVIYHRIVGQAILLVLFRTSGQVMCSYINQPTAPQYVSQNSWYATKLKL